MAELTTGLIDNFPVNGARPSVSVALRITNDGDSTETVRITVLSQWVFQRSICFRNS
ncbi:hypothetical protein HMPREF0322_03102 [Desulfitobacterium hafniense DP7]|uniref:Uncharacterized protein n=1 Tax=Desulfitobacterium hafniense DP7 TaxID=537010 RepID=G9XQ56_DESHA|nr:hypothetical protein HMPREF0322_03102 [Desulfitobacterium hafniense DP7]